MKYGGTRQFVNGSKEVVIAFMKILREVNFDDSFLLLTPEFSVFPPAAGKRKH
jgi:hypothetical protein